MGESSFLSNLLSYVVTFESFLRSAWEENPSAWSFATARALAIRWRSGKLKTKKRRTMMKKWAKEHVDRFMGRSSGDISEGILAKIGPAGCTCGPLQGLTSLLSILSDAELVQVVLKLMEKDVDAYQLTPKSDGSWGDLVNKVKVVDGTFRRDDAQLKMEKR